MKKLKRFTPWLFIPASPLFIVAMAREAYMFAKTKEEKQELLKNTLLSFYFIPKELLLLPFRPEEDAA